MRQAFARWDTLGLRLFMLMWLALVLSHAAAWGWNQLGGPASPSHRPPSLGDGPPALRSGPSPPPGAPHPPGEGAPRPPVPRAEGHGDWPTFPSLPPMSMDGGPGLPAGALMADYGIRLLLIALASWWGARWLARPMAQLSAGAQGLERALSLGLKPPQLEENSGTREVRQGAAAFNQMAAQLKRQFDERGLMVAAMSHDLRTPLTRLRVRLEGAPMPEEWRARSISDLQEMSALIDTTLEVFSLQSRPPGAWQRVELSALLQAVADDAAELGQEVQSLATEPVYAQTDPLALQRIVGNLVSNAVRYGQRARLSLQRDSESRLCIHVEDDGPGIPPALLAEVMQPFVRLEASRNRETGGVGLGLYIARELSRRLGAELHLRNRASGGLQAIVRL